MTWAACTLAGRIAVAPLHASAVNTPADARYASHECFVRPVRLSTKYPTGPATHQYSANTTNPSVAAAPMARPKPEAVATA